MIGIYWNALCVGFELLEFELQDSVCPHSESTTKQSRRYDSMTIKLQISQKGIYALWYCYVV